MNKGTLRRNREVNKKEKSCEYSVKTIFVDFNQRTCQYIGKNGKNMQKCLENTLKRGLPAFRC